MAETNKGVAFGQDVDNGKNEKDAQSLQEKIASAKARWHDEATSSHGI